MVRLRVAWRLAGVGLHLFAGLLTVLLVYPRVGAATRLRLRQDWSARLLRILGVELRSDGSAAAGAMIVGNHVSWLDIFVINALSPAAFVCKDDVRHWPLIGWLCAHNDTIFIARGSSRDARQVGKDIAATLAGGAAVAVFPEGTTSDGSHLLPFRAALLQPAISLGVPVQAVLVRYRDAAGGHSSAPVYIGETTLLGSMQAIAAQPKTLAILDFLPRLSTQGMDRRELAACLETTLWEAMQRVTSGQVPSPPEQVAWVSGFTA